MLIRFKVENFLSFNGPQELSMISGDTRNHNDHVHKFNDISLLRMSAIYGANASGKSNLIKAIGSSKQMIVSGIPIPSNRYFKPSLKNKDKSSYFEYEFENDGRYYSYGFEFLLSKQRIRSEWLYELRSEGDNKVIYQRIDNNITHSFEGDSKTRMDIYIKDMKNSDTTLFLKEMSRKTIADDKSMSVFADVFEWFSKKLNVFGTRDFSYDVLDAAEDEKDTVIRYLAALGTGITGIGDEHVQNPEEIFHRNFINDLRERMIRKNDKGSKLKVNSSSETYIISLSESNEITVNRRVFKHQNPDISFGTEEESEGTQRLYNMFSMMASKANDHMYVVDELDIKLHPQLTYRFVELFIKEKAGTKNQLIFTTHESNLMDFRLLRRDEIWFVEKGEDESSSLYSLEDFNERTDRKIDKAYLEGRYGGVPIFSTAFPPHRGDADETLGK